MKLSCFLLVCNSIPRLDKEVHVFAIKYRKMYEINVIPFNNGRRAIKSGSTILVNAIHHCFLCEHLILLCFR